MDFSETRQLASMAIDRPNMKVTIEFPSEGSRNACVFRIPEGSKWHAMPHWHERYVEFFRVIKGRVLILLDGKKIVATPESGVQMIPKLLVHDFMRADAVEETQDSGEVIVEESTDPSDGMKEIFFRNVLSTVVNSQTRFGRLTPVQLGLTSATYDNWDVFLPGPFAWLATHTIYGAYQLLGRVLGLRPWYEEFTPSHLHPVASSGGTYRSMKQE